MTKTEIIKLFVAVIIFAVVIAVVAVLGRIDTAQTIQLIITFVLVLVTVAYVKRTAEIASATKEQAHASVKMAKTMVKPTLTPDFRLAPHLDADGYVRFEAGINNDGNGLAYDLEPWIEDGSTPPSKLLFANKVSFLRGHQSVSLSMPDPRLYLPKSDKVQRRILVIKYKDIDGEYEIRQQFDLTTVETEEEFSLGASIKYTKPIVDLGPLSKRTIGKQNLEDELP